MIQTTGVYFDGISSVSQLIEVSLDDQNIVFITNDLQINRWLVQNIRFEHPGNTLQIRLGENQTAFIKITDSEFIQTFIAQLNQNGHIGWYYKLLHLGMKAYIGVAVALLVMIVCGYLFIVPWVAEKAVLIIPESYDASLGTNFYTEYLTQNNVDSAKTLLLNQFAHKLRLNNRRVLHFTVVNSTEVNAFALPDGHIVVFTGLLKLTKNYDELAGLIGHEVIHVNNRHSMKMLCRNLSGYIFISAVFSDVNGVMAIIADNAHNLQALSYSREFEKEADEEGTALMIQNNIDPHGMTQLFTRIKENDDITIPAFISSHPLTDDRIDNINNLIKSKHHQDNSHPDLDNLYQKIKE